MGKVVGIGFDRSIKTVVQSHYAYQAHLLEQDLPTGTFDVADGRELMYTIYTIRGDATNSAAAKHPNKAHACEVAAACFYPDELTVAAKAELDGTNEVKSEVKMESQKRTKAELKKEVHKPKAEVKREAQGDDSQDIQEVDRPTSSTHCIWADLQRVPLTCTAIEQRAIFPATSLECWRPHMAEGRVLPRT